MPGKSRQIAPMTGGEPPAGPSASARTQEATSTACSQQCLDIFVPKPSSPLWLILPICLTGSLIPLFMMIFQQRFTSMTPLVSGSLAVAAIGGLSLLAFMYHSREHCAEIRKYAEKTPVADVRSYIAAIAHSVPLSADRRILKEVANALRNKHLAGVVVRLWWQSPPEPPGGPIDVPFEPIQLDEVDQAFFDLGESISPQSELTSGRASNHSADDQLMRRFRRFAKMPGLLIITIGLIIQFVGFSMLLLESGVIDWRFGLWGILVVMMGWIFFRGYGVDPTLWWLVPGGLIRRTPRKRSASSEVHLFHHECSVLLFRPQSKHLWTMIVSDAATFGTVLVSELEMDMALRAWLSPIPPPSVEKLVDLT